MVRSRRRGDGPDDRPSRAGDGREDRFPDRDPPLRGDRDGYRLVPLFEHVVRSARGSVPPRGRGGTAVGDRAGAVRERIRGETQAPCGVLGTLRLNAAGTVAWVEVSRKLIDDSGADPADSEGLANYPRSIRGVEVGISFEEISPDAHRVSLRSRGRVDVAGAAAAFGGGGVRRPRERP